MTQGYASAGRSDTGRVRRHNEDAILVQEDGRLWVVADGLGGHAAGDVASRMVVERLATLRLPYDLADAMDAVEDMLGEVNRQLRALARERRVDTIASTVVLMVHTPELVAFGWVGDSRAYRYEGGRLRCLTHDHVQGRLSAETRVGVGERPAPGVLTRAVGAEDTLHVDWVLSPRRAGMTFLLCSDGINKELLDSEIETVCQRHASPNAVLDSLMHGALQRGARDNVSAVVIRLEALEEAMA